MRTEVTTPTTKYDHLIGSKYGGPSLDPLAGPPGDIFGIITKILGLTNTGRLAVKLRSDYEVTMPLDLAQGYYHPKIDRATTEVTFPDDSTATLHAFQLDAVIKTVGAARTALDADFTDGVQPGDTTEVTFPSGSTCTLDYLAARTLLRELVNLRADLGRQDAAARDAARAAYFADTSR